MQKGDEIGNVINYLMCATIIHLKVISAFGEIINIIMRKQLTDKSEIPPFCVLRALLVYAPVKHKSDVVEQLYRIF